MNSEASRKRLRGELAITKGGGTEAPIHLVYSADANFVGKSTGKCPCLKYQFAHHHRLSPLKANKKTF
jgi:hypothetical protein